MTEHPESSGDSFTPPAAPPPPAGAPPNPYAYPPGPPSGPPSGPYGGAYPPPPMPYGDYYAGAPAVMRNGLGVAALITGILGLFGSCSVVFGVLLGIAAIIMGLVARGRVKRGQASNGGMATAGIVLGVLAIIVSIVWVMWVFKGADVPQFFDCLSNAGQDSVKTDLCTSDFEERVADLFGQPAPRS